MPERFWKKEKAVVAQGREVKSRGEAIRCSDLDLMRRLGEYPELKAKIENMLAIMENAGGDVEKASEAEARIMEELRRMGNEVLHGWARHQQEKKAEVYERKPGVNRKEKKGSTGTRG